MFWQKPLQYNERQAVDLLRVKGPTLPLALEEMAAEELAPLRYSPWQQVSSRYLTALQSTGDPDKAISEAPKFWFPLDRSIQSQRALVRSICTACCDYMRGNFESQVEELRDETLREELSDGISFVVQQENLCFLQGARLDVWACLVEGRVRKSGRLIAFNKGLFGEPFEEAAATMLVLREGQVRAAQAVISDMAFVDELRSIERKLEGYFEWKVPEPFRPLALQRVCLALGDSISEVRDEDPPDYLEVRPGDPRLLVHLNRHGVLVTHCVEPNRMNGALDLWRKLDD